MAIFNYVMGEVEDVVREIVSKSEEVQQVMDTIENGVNPLEGGLWTGGGADAFYEEVRTRLIPEITALIASIGGFQTSIIRSEERIVQADNEVTRVVDDLRNAYEDINI